MNIIQRVAAYVKPPVEKKEGSFSMITAPIEVVPARIDKFLAALSMARGVYSQERKILYDMYQNSIDFDSQLRSLIEKRVLNTSGRKLEYVNSVGKPIKAANKILEAPRFNQFIRDAIYYRVFWGMGLFEIRTKKWNEQMLFDYNVIPPEHIDPYEQLVRKTAYGEDREDKSYKDKRNVIFVGSPEDFGLLLPATIQCIYKRAAMNDYAQYSVLAGTNFQTIKYRGKVPDQKQREAIRRQMLEARGGVIDLPPDIDVMTENQSSTSQNQLFENKLKYHDEQLAKLILGQTMTTEDGSSYAQAEVHERQQETIFDSDAKAIIDMLNYDFIEGHKILGVTMSGRWQFADNNSVKVEKNIEIDLKLKQLGYNFTPEQIAEKYELDNPEKSKDDDNIPDEQKEVQTD
jgi:hypothetical protein